MKLGTRSMAVETRWHDEANLIMIQTLRGFWTLNDMRDAYTVAEAMVDKPYPIVDFIIDMRESRWIPPGVLSLGTRLGLSGGVSVVVSNQQFLRTLTGVMQRLLPHETILHAETIDEADTLIRDAQATRKR